MKNAKRKLGIAGLLLSGITALSPVQAQEKPEVLDNFDYASHRNVPLIDGRSYEGVIFNYNLLSDAVISQSDKKRVHIEPIWFYDIDNDGKFGKAERNAIKAGIPIFMHQAFNDIANKKIRKFLDIASEYSSLSEKLRQEENNSHMYQERVKELENKIIEYQSQLSPRGYETEKRTALPTPEVPEETKERKEVPELYSIPQIGSEAEEYPSLEIPKRPKAEKISKISREKKAKEGEKPYFSLTTQLASDSTLDDYSASLGARYNFNKHLGLGVNLDVGYGLDKLIEEYTAPLSCGRTAYGTIKDSERLSVGGSLEAQIGPLVLGAGLDSKSWLSTTLEQIKDSYGNVLKSNTNSVPSRQVFAKVYGGLEVPLTQNWKLGAVGGYNWKDGAYAGLRTAIKLNNRKK